MSIPDDIRSHERLHRDRQIEDFVHDPYRQQYKPKEPSVCPRCGVLFARGHFHWGARPANAHEHLCPACHRIQDSMPAGYVTLAGPFFAAHRDVILQLVRNEAQRTRTEHALERIIEIRADGDDTIVTTTDVHLAKRIGDAVHSAYQGELETKYSNGEYLVRVRWSR